MHTPDRMATAFIRSWVVAGGVLALPTQLHAATPPAVHLTNEQDHNRLLELLHITQLRRGPDGDPTSPRAANFDESKVAPDPPLPQPLLLQSGGRVATGAVWWKSRRPEILAAFDSQIYGR